MIKVSAIRCPSCSCIIYSRARHDFRGCPCGETAIDGGFDYTKISAKEPTKIGYVEVELDCTREDLYDDWNKGVDFYGRITSASTHIGRKNYRIISERWSKE